MTRKDLIERVKEYFAEKGGPMTLQEYKYAPDAPVKLNILKAKIGSWDKILKMAGAELSVTVTIDPVDEEEAVEEAKVEEPAKQETSVVAPKAKTKGA